MVRDNGKPSLLIFFFLFSLAATASLFYTPALPAIGESFGISRKGAQLLVTYYLVGFAAAQLLYGPVANAIGRKKTVFVGGGVGLIGLLVAIVAGCLSGIYWLLAVGMTVMALGLGVSIVMSLTIIGDAFEERRATQAMAIGVLSVAIVPGIAVLVSGWLVHNYSWQASYYLMAGYTLFVMALVTRLPETGKNLGRRPIFAGYRRQFSNPRVLLGGITISPAVAWLYVYAAKGPFIGIQLIGLTPAAYGLYHLKVTSGILIGSLLTIALANRVAGRKLVVLGTLIAGVGVALQLISFSIGWISPWTLFMPLGIALIGGVIVFNAIAAMVTTRADDKANSSAVMAFIYASVVTLSALLAGVIYPHSPLALPLFLTALYFVMVAGGITLARRLR